MWPLRRRPAVNVRRSGAGTPYVLIHGLGGESCVWEPVLPALEERHEVLAVDLPGFGKSPALPDGVVPTPAALADAVAARLDELGIGAVHVAGNSLGGWVALELARSGRARSVVGLCPAGLWGAPLSSGAAPVRGRGHRTARRLRPLIPVVMLSRRVRRTVLSPFVAHPERVPYHAAWRMVRSYARATAYEATSTAMRQGAFDGAGEIDVPVTLAFGERDRLIRPTTLATPGARSVVLRDCGHIPMWDAPETVARLLVEGATAGESAGQPQRSSSAARM
jgi:pimeloyl-ACP methyl ester carboxylesterase